MNEEMFGGFLKGGIATCLVMAVLSTLLRWKKFGPSAIVLGAAFGVFALLLFGFQEGWPQSRIISVGVAIVILLAADAMLRSNANLKR